MIVLECMYHCKELQIMLFSLHKFYTFVYLENVTWYAVWVHGGTKSMEIKDTKLHKMLAGTAASHGLRQTMT
jgi:hypothetical protein